MGFNFAFLSFVSQIFVLNTTSNSLRGVVHFSIKSVLITWNENYGGEADELIKKIDALSAFLNEDEKKLLIEIENEYDTFQINENEEAVWVGFCLGAVLSGNSINCPEVK